MSLRSWTALALLAFACGGDTSNTAPPRLTAADFTVGGVPALADSSVIIRSFGRPQRVSVESEAMDLKAWHYPDVRFTINEVGQWYGVTLTGSRFATARGLRIGDPTSKLQALYGHPVEIVEDLWFYRVSEEPLNNMKVTVARDRVTEISLAYEED
jgi:hypothetical protein